MGSPSVRSRAKDRAARTSETRTASAGGVGGVREVTMLISAAAARRLRENELVRRRVGKMQTLRCKLSELETARPGANATAGFFARVRHWVNWLLKARRKRLDLIRFPTQLATSPGT